MSHTITLRTWPQAHDILRKSAEWIKGRTLQGKPVVLTLADEKRTLPQNRHVHPIIKEIAVEAKRPTDAESLRRLRYLLLEAWRHDTNRNPVFERSLDGMRWVNVDSGTSDLDKPDCAEFIDWLMAWQQGTT